jgi:hypothetical protein
MEDVVYFSRRAQEEREAALRASNFEVRQVHLRFAEAYEAKVRNLTAIDRRSKLRAVETGSLQHPAAGLARGQLRRLLEASR